MSAGSEISATDLVSILCSIPSREFSPEIVKDALSSCVVKPASLSKFLHWLPKTYTRNMLYRDDTFEVLALCWAPGTASTIHNHSQQDCWMHIHRGSLCLEDFGLENPAHRGKVGVDIVVRREGKIARAPMGTVDHRGADNEIHRVINCRSFKSRAVSIHVYARPIDTCIVYQTRQKTAQRLQLAYHSAEGLLI